MQSIGLVGGHGSKTKLDRAKTCRILWRLVCAFLPACRRNDPSRTAAHVVCLSAPDGFLVVDNLEQLDQHLIADLNLNAPVVK
jgi:glycine/D-amino acid oxidase-like deaminating enzyme